jgi:GNAT superfamily N-acetyltransferase
MKYDVLETHELSPNYTFEEISISKEDLFPIFLECFETGDAQFYHSLSEEDKITFFNEQLGFPECITHPASQLVYYDNQLIGFALCMDYLRNNIHISCMCVLPDFQKKGIGKLILEHIESWCKLHNISSITLGTEKEMNAFKLYSNFGFRITESHMID